MSVSLDLTYFGIDNPMSDLHGQQHNSGSLRIVESLELEATSDLRIWLILRSWGSLRS